MENAKLNVNFYENNAIFNLKYNNKLGLRFELTKEEILKIAHQAILVYEKGDFNGENTIKS